MFIITNTNNYFAKMDDNLNQMLQLLGCMFVINNKLEPNLLRNDNLRGDITQDSEVMGRMFSINNNMSLHTSQPQNEITEIVNGDMHVHREQVQQVQQVPGGYRSAPEIQYGEMPPLEDADLEDSDDEMPPLEDADGEMPPLEDADLEDSDDEMPPLEDADGVMSTLEDADLEDSDNEMPPLEDADLEDSDDEMPPLEDADLEDSDDKMSPLLDKIRWAYLSGNPNPNAIHMLEYVEQNLGRITPLEDADDVMSTLEDTDIEDSDDEMPPLEDADDVMSTLDDTDIEDSDDEMPPLE